MRKIIDGVYRSLKESMSGVTIQLVENAVRSALTIDQEMINRARAAYIRGHNGEHGMNGADCMRLALAAALSDPRSTEIEVSEEQKNAGLRAFYGMDSASDESAMFTSRDDENKVIAIYRAMDAKRARLSKETV